MHRTWLQLLQRDVSFPHIGPRARMNFLTASCGRWTALLAPVKQRRPPFQVSAFRHGLPACVSPLQWAYSVISCLSQGLKSQPQTMSINVMAQIPLCSCRTRFPLHFLQAGLPQSHLNCIYNSFIFTLSSTQA